METFEPQKLLCPVDFSQHSELALRMAGDIAAAFNAAVLVLHAQRFEAPLYFRVAQYGALTPLAGGVYIQD